MKHNVSRVVEFSDSTVELLDQLIPQEEQSSLVENAVIEALNNLFY